MISMPQNGPTSRRQFLGVALGRSLHTSRHQASGALVRLGEPCHIDPQSRCSAAAAAAAAAAVSEAPSDCTNINAVNSVAE
jgi:hypothetical protein